MKLYMNIREEAQRLLMMGAPHVDTVNGTDYVCSPVGLSPLMEFTPKVYPGGHGDDEFKNQVVADAYAKIPAILTTITGLRGKTQEDQPNDRVNNQCLGNRPTFYPQSTSANGNEPDVTKYSMLRYDHDVIVQQPWGASTTTKTPSTVKLNRIFLEQLMVASSDAHIQNKKDDGSQKREDNSIGSLFAVIPQQALKLGMKQPGLSTLEIKLERSSDWRGIDTHGQETIPGDSIGWGDYYAKSAIREPDAPKDSMNWPSMWKENAPICVLYPLQTRYRGNGKWGWDKDSDDRVCERETQAGRGGTERDEFQSILNDSFDHGGYPYTSIGGTAMSVSSDAATAADGDTAAAFGTSTSHAASNLIKQAIDLCLRNFAISLFFHSRNNDRYVGSGNSCTQTSWGTAIGPEQLWFHEAWDPQKLQWLKAYMSRIDWNPYGLGHYSQGDITTHLAAPGEFLMDQVTIVKTESAAVDSWSTSGATRAAAAGLTIKVTGQISHYVQPWNNIYTSWEWATPASWQAKTYGEYADKAFSNHARPLLGQNHQEGEGWLVRAVGRVASPAVLYSSSEQVRTRGAHIPFAWDASGSAVTPSGLAATDPGAEAGLLKEGTAWPLLGSAVGAMFNLCSGFFEDEIETDVSDWDDGGAFFAFFFSTLRR